jgi:molybdopterin-guanine dinucleotide biosynthesis protein B
MTARRPILFGLAGWSGSGKTTIAEQLITLFSRQGLAVGTIKHAHHEFDADVKGKDSWRHRQAGAVNVIVSSDIRTAQFTEHANQSPPSLDELLARSQQLDIVLVEGFKREAVPKIEIWRAENNKPCLFPDDDQIKALAAPAPIEDCPLPQLDLNNAAEVAEFVLSSNLFLRG